VVPPSQAEKMVAALKNRGIAVSYVAFENEQHGFRQAATIKAALEAELYFYSVIFGFDTAEDLPGIPIENIDD
ncbi:MAG: S9 family peptidase, partial [Gammaproteobacteria bacterium]|nr:S9 family peptidase [Gammaproteobacteria bacterium]